jgi:hypothetical protein
LLQAKLRLAAHAPVLALVTGLKVAEVPVWEGRFGAGERAPIAAREFGVWLVEAMQLV